MSRISNTAVNQADMMQVSESSWAMCWNSDLGGQENPLCLQLVEFISQEVDRLGVGVELLVRGAAGRLHLRSRQNGNSRLNPL